MANGKVTLAELRAKYDAMTQEQKTAALRRVLAFVDMHELDEWADMTEESVDSELREMGVDVEAFAASVRERIAKAIAEGKALPDCALKDG
jgi:hypothetical protein